MLPDEIHNLFRDYKVLWDHKVFRGNKLLEAEKQGDKLILRKGTKLTSFHLIKGKIKKYILPIAWVKYFSQRLTYTLHSFMNVKSELRCPNFF